MIELRNSHLAGHSRRVADLARRLAQKLVLGNKTSQEVFVAGLLHTIGKVGFDDGLLGTPAGMLTTQQLSVFRKHPARAAQLLLPLPELKSVAEIISAQLERFDGDGYPDQLSGQKIPVGARLIQVASDYDGFQIGTLLQRKLEPAQAQEKIVQDSGKRYDPEVVAALVALLGEKDLVAVPKDEAAEKSVHAKDLRAGMMLARDLITPSGLLMLTSGYVLDNPVIDKIIDFEKSMGLKLTVDVSNAPTC
jgi:response regulator RpfG family c-di-GMP phosphodiesterase